MSTRTIHINLPSDILLALNETESELEQRLKTSLAIRLYKQQKLTIGKSAQVAGLSRLEFDSVLTKNKVNISNLDLNDVLSDIDKLS